MNDEIKYITKIIEHAEKIKADVEINYEHDCEDGKGARFTIDIQGFYVNEE